MRCPVPGAPDNRKTTMNLIALLLAFLFAVQYVTLPSALATQVSLNIGQSGGMQGQVPVHKIGNLLFGEGIAILNGSEISVVAKAQTTSNPLEAALKGQIVKAETVSSGGDTFVKGISYFNGGPSLPKLEPNCHKESVDLTDGSKVSGPISDVTSQAVSIAGKSIPMGSVSAIHSPHAFNFNMKVNGPNSSGAVKGDSSGMNFSPTCHQTAELHANKKLLIATVVVLGIATAISCGVAIPLATHHHHHPITPIFPTPTQPQMTVATFKPIILRPFPNPGLALNVATIKFQQMHPLLPPPPPPPPPPPRPPRMPPPNPFVP